MFSSLSRNMQETLDAISNRVRKLNLYIMFFKLTIPTLSACCNMILKISWEIITSISMCTKNTNPRRII